MDQDNQHHGDMLWGIGVFDAHCHPTDQMPSIGNIEVSKARVLTIMATRSEDQELVAQTADRFSMPSMDTIVSREGSGCYVVPSFGWHPWFSHQLYDDTEQSQKNCVPDKYQHYSSVLTPDLQDEEFLQALPSPRSLAEFLSQTEAYLETYPHALVGEIGLDRAFRIPQGWTVAEQMSRDQNATPGSREGRALSPYHVTVAHQKRILRSQLRLAGKHQRPVSIHSVQAHGAVFEVLEELWAGHEKEVISKRQRKRRGSAPGAHDTDDKELGDDDFDQSRIEKDMPFPPRICLHSYSGPPEPLKQFLRPSVPSEIFFSFSACINFSNPSTDKVTQVIKALHEDRLLIESDLHCAGEQMDDLLEDVARKICSIKGWTLEKGLEHFKANWIRFALG